jgi:RNAse (barnase) inhibitor barstar
MKQIFTIAPPWVEVICNATDGFSKKLIQECPGSFVVARIPGEKCETKEDLFTHFGSTLKFPNYFGKNWNAFEECIRDLEWLPAGGYVIVIDRAERLLIVNESDYRLFVDIMQKAGREWGKPQLGEWPRAAIPFHLILTTTMSNASETRSWLVPVSSYS